MIPFGETLRLAREEKGLSTKDIAEATNLLVQHIESLEREDFSRIAAPIYGRGFVKLYCEAVGLDPKPLIEAFMDIYSGNRAPTIKTKGPVRIAKKTPSAPTPPPPPPVTPQTTPLSPQPEEATPPAPQGESQEVQDDNQFHLESETVAPQKAFDPPTTPRVSPFSPPEAPASPFERSKGPSKYSSPKPIDEDIETSFSIPPVVWRVALVGIGLGFIITLAVVGIRAIYNASMTTGETQVAKAAKVELPNVEPSDTSVERVKRTPMKIEPLFIPKF